ncbi:MAG: PAS domain-containing protein [Lachnospiraceae bacterium]|nr:PAS domain-containing protein [uncultured Acetatifactor sp.]MCI8543832.1 PAS domain-containing protein [Lachnospiraceae bacterium]
MRKPQQKERRSLVLSEQTFPIIEQITAGMPGGFFIYHANRDEQLIYANQALIQIYGCESLEEFQELTGYVFPGLIHPEDVAAAEQSIRQQIFTCGKDFDYVEYRIIRKDGSVRWLADYGHFVHTDSFGDIFYVFVEDTTEQKRKAINDAHIAQLAQERLEALEALEHESTALKLVHEILHSGMWTMEFDRQGQMTSVFWSQEFRTMIGYRDEQDFPNALNSWSDLLHPDDHDRVLEQYYAAINDYTGKRLYNVEYRLLTKDRGYRWFRATGKLSRREDGTPITYVGMFVDITRRKETDAQLLEQRKLLEEALIKAQRASRAKTTFLNNMSHDIRTPMNAIIGFTKLASAHLGNQQLVQNYLEKITASSSHLLSLINDVLDMSRIESGKVVIEEKPCNLPQILLNLQSMIQADLKSKELHFHLDDSSLIHPYIICDQLRLNQVLLNVLSNALKFTPPGGSISVSATEHPGEGPDSAVYEFCIRDTGIGMVPEFIEHIFEPFERERTSTVSGIQGTGLGMSITKNLTELMKGRITVESKKDCGSTFTFTFPFRLSQNVDSQSLPEASAAAKHLSGSRLLLAEDNELNQEIAVTILEDAGCIVDVASNGAEAVEKVRLSRENPYDLILMDIQMPVMDGIEATKTIRAMDDLSLASLPIVAMTANAFEEDRQLVLSAGMNAHLGKPIDIDKLFSTLARILGNP